MPNPRLWEFEEGTTNLGAIDAAPDDLGRLLLLEFALVYGNDFLHIPIDLEIGSLCWIDDLTVHTTFGETVAIPSVEQADGPAGPWSLFRLAIGGGTSPKAPRADFLLLPPALGPSHHSPPVEEIQIMRDEMANVAWAVEERVQNPAGTISVPHEAAQDRRRRQPAPSSPPPGPAPPASTLVYQLASDLPEHWHPLLPVPIPHPGTTPGSGWNEIALELSGIHPPHGQLLRAGGAGPLRIAEEEVLQSGVVVSRSWQRARWIDGSTHLWVQRTKRVGRGEGSSGLSYDTVRAD